MSGTSTSIPATATPVNTPNPKLTKPQAVIYHLKDHARHHPHHPMPHDRLVALVWGQSYLSTDCSRLLHATITLARRQAGDSSLIVVERNVGYRWAGSIESEDA